LIEEERKRKKRGGAMPWLVLIHMESDIISRAKGTTTGKGEEREKEKAPD